MKLLDTIPYKYNVIQITVYCLQASQEGFVPYPGMLSFDCLTSHCCQRVQSMRKTHSVLEK